MKPSTKNEIEGNFHKVKAEIKEKAGQVTNKAAGKAEHNGALAKNRY